MNSINWFAVLAAGFSAFVLGGVWYSPALFGNVWMKENRITAAEVQKGNKARIFGWSFILALIMAANLAMFLADAKTDLVWGLTAGALAGVWVFSGIAITAMFEMKSSRYIFINGGYHLVALTLMGGIIGIWR